MEKGTGMAEYGVLKRTLLLIGALTGCLGGFVGFIFSVGAVLQRPEDCTVFTLSEPITLPCRVEGTGLIAQQLVMYEGPYLENGGDVPVSDITALLLYNDGKQEIDQTEVILTAQQELTFLASNIMPGARVLVLEKNATPWQQWQVLGCSGWVNAVAGSQMPEAALEITEVDMGTLSVTNTTDEGLGELWLYYKNYLPEEELYIGGITFIKTIEYLNPGQVLLVNPEHYAVGYSRIVKIEKVE